MEIRKQLGKRIQKIRKSKNFTQEELAEQIGIDTKSVSKIENGGSYPGAETLSSIIRILNVKPYELFVFDDEIPYQEMRTEILNSLDDNKTVLALYERLKGIN